MVQSPFIVVQSTHLKGTARQLARQRVHRGYMQHRRIRNSELRIRCESLRSCVGNTPDARGSFHTTALHLAVRERCFSSVCDIVSNGGNPNAGDVNGATALHYAVEFSANDDNRVILERVQLLRALLQGGGDPNKRDNQRRTPLHVAAGRPNARYAIHTLLNWGCKSTAADATGRTPLTIARQNRLTANIAAFTEWNSRK